MTKTVFKIELVVFHKIRKRPLCGRVKFCSIDNFFQTHKLLMEFGRRKKTNNNIGYAINTYSCLQQIFDE